MPTYNIFINKDWPNTGNYTKIQGDFDDKQIAWDILKSLVEEQYYWVGLVYSNESYICSWDTEGPYCNLNIGEIKTKYTEQEVLWDTFQTNISKIVQLEKENSEILEKYYFNLGIEINN